MLKEINFMARLSKLVSTVSHWIKRDKTVAGPFRCTGKVETGGLDGDVASIYVNLSDNKEYVVFGGRYSLGGVKHRLIGKEGIKLIASRPDPDADKKRKDKNIYLKELVLSDDVTPEVGTSLREHIRAACEYSNIQFEDLSLR